MGSRIMVAFVGFVKIESTWFDETLVFEEDGFPKMAGVRLGFNN